MHFRQINEAIIVCECGLRLYRFGSSLLGEHTEDDKNRFQQWINGQLDFYYVHENRHFKNSESFLKTIIQSQYRPKFLWLKSKMAVLD